MADNKDLNKENKEADDIQEENITEETKAAGGAEEAAAEETAEETAEAEGGEPAKEAEKGTEEAEKAAAEEPAGEEKAGNEGASSGGKRFWQKKAKKDKKDEKIEELTDRLARSMAEFDNFRKRTEKEKAANYVVGAKEVIEKLLPVLDNFERGLANANADDPFAQGMEKIWKQMETVLTDLGVEMIDAEGQAFDPNLHNAVMHVEDESLGENVVAEVLQKGYTYKGLVVRYAMVKVAN